MKKLNPRKKQLLKIAISVLLLAVLIHTVDWGKVWLTLSGAKAVYLVLAVGLLTLERCVSVLKWLVLLKVKGSGISFWRLFLINYIGGFWSLFTPSSVSTDIIRGYYLARTTSDTALAVSSIVVDHLLSLAGLILVGTTGVWFFGSEVGIPCSGLFLPATATIIFASYFAIQNRRFMDFINRTIIRRITFRNLHEHLEKWFQGCVDFGRYPMPVLYSFLLSIAVQAIRVLIFYVIALALNVPGSIAYYFMFIPLINIAIMLPSYNGAGVRELCFMALAKYINIDKETAVAVASAVTVITTLTTAAGGLIYFFVPDIGKPESKKSES